MTDLGGMTLPDASLLDRFHRVLVEEIRRSKPEYLTSPFTVAEIYQHLVPYRTHRDAIGVEINGDYEDALLRLLAGEGDYLLLDSEPALREIRSELRSPNPDTTLYREFAALDVRLNPAGLPGAVGAVATAGDDPPRPRRRPPEPPELGLAPAEPPGPPAPQAAPPADVRSEEPVPHRAVRSAVPAHETPAEGAPSSCRSCGESLPPRDEVSFCPFCGTDQRTVPCPECGETLDPEWRYCIGCGYAVQD